MYNLRSHSAKGGLSATPVFDHTTFSYIWAHPDPYSSPRGQSSRNKPPILKDILEISGLNSILTLNVISAAAETNSYLPIYQSPVHCPQSPLSPISVPPPPSRLSVSFSLDPHPPFLHRPLSPLPLSLKLTPSYHQTPPPPSLLPPPLLLPPPTTSTSAPISSSFLHHQTQFQPL